MRIIQSWPSNEALYFIHTNNHTILTLMTSLSIPRYQRLVTEAPSADRGVHFSCTARMSYHLNCDITGPSMFRPPRFELIEFFICASSPGNSSGWVSSEAKPNLIESESCAINPNLTHFPPISSWAAEAVLWSRCACSNSSVPS